jgi:aminotransferase/cystathionine beta-lyase
LKDNNRKLVNNPLIHENNTYYIDYKDLEEKAADPKNKVLFFCSPQNPAGRVWKREELLRVAEICMRNNVLIISDEVHSDIIMPGHTHIPFATLSPEINDHIITCTAPSKTFNLAGMYASNIIIANQDLRDRFNKVRSKHGIFRPNMVGMKACELAYTKAGGWRDACKAKLN